MTKAYDQAYFQRWYHSRQRVVTPHGIRRRAHLALSAAEYFLERPVRRVLDVGCGEGLWRASLRRMRPRLEWYGVDSSDFIVRRYGRRRGIRQGSFGELGKLGLRGPFDLIICSDVLHYLPTSDIRRGLPALTRLLGGVVWLDSFTSDDPMDGDHENWQSRSPAQYRRLFRNAGLVGLGMNCWAKAAWARDRVGALEGCT